MSDRYSLRDNVCLCVQTWDGDNCRVAESMEGWRGKSSKLARVRNTLAFLAPLLPHQPMSRSRATCCYGKSACAMRVSPSRLALVSGHKRCFEYSCGTPSPSTPSRYCLRRSNRGAAMRFAGLGWVCGRWRPVSGWLAPVAAAESFQSLGLTPLRASSSRQPGRVSGKDPKGDVDGLKLAI